MMNRTLEPTEALSGFDADVYDNLSRKHRSCIDRPFIRKVLSLGIREGVALDIGCGPGHVAVSLALRCPGLIVHALDSSESMLQIVRRNAEAAGVADRVIPVLGDACHLPFEARSLDLVISLHTWHHLPDPGPAMKEIARVLSPNGAFMVRDLRRPRTSRIVDTLVAGFGFLLGYNPDERIQYRNSLLAALTPDDMHGWACEAGLENAQIARQWACHMDLWRAAPAAASLAAQPTAPGKALRWLPIWTRQIS